MSPLNQDWCSSGSWFVHIELGGTNPDFKSVNIQHTYNFITWNLNRYHENITHTMHYIECLIFNVWFGYRDDINLRYSSHSTQPPPWIMVWHCRYRARQTTNEIIHTTRHTTYDTPHGTRHTTYDTPHDTQHTTLYDLLSSFHSTVLSPVFTVSM